MLLLKPVTAQTGRAETFSAVRFDNAPPLLITKPLSLSPVYKPAPSEAALNPKPDKIREASAAVLGL